MRAMPVPSMVRGDPDGGVAFTWKARPGSSALPCSCRPIFINSPSPLTDPLLYCQLVPHRPALALVRSRGKSSTSVPKRLRSAFASGFA